MTTQQDDGHAGAVLSAEQESSATRAQVRYPLGGLTRQCTENPALFGIVTGAISGALSHLALWTFADRLRDLGLRDLGIMLPGPIFGVAVAFCLWLFGSRNKVISGLAIAITTAGWYSAYFISMVSTINLRDLGLADWSASALGGIPGGAVGGIAVAFAVSLASSRFRRFKTWALTVLVATVAGTTLGVALQNDIGPLLLFVVWQAAVLTSISYGLLPAQSRKD